MLNVNPASVLKVVGTVDPQVLTTELFSDPIDLSNWESVFAVLLLGNMAADATVDMSVMKCDYDGGNASAAFKSAAHRGADASANDNKQIVMAVQAGEIAGTDKQFIKFRTVSGGSGGPAAMIVFGVATRYDPSADPVDDTQSVQLIAPTLASVIETVY